MVSKLNSKRKRRSSEASNDGENIESKLTNVAEELDNPTAKHTAILQKFKSATTEKKDNVITKDVDNNTEKEVKVQDVQGLVPLPQPDPAKRRLITAQADTWMTDPIYVKTSSQKAFEKLGLSEKMLNNLKSMGIQTAFAVQTSVIPTIMSDSQSLAPDPKAPILVNAATGSGKTLAYGVPVVEVLSHRIVPRIRALVILPTRPLMQQVRGVLEQLARGTSLRVMALRSERPFQEEQGLLKTTTPDILVTTPGRLVDHIRSTIGFDLSHLRFLIIDEADRLLNQSFQDWVGVVLDAAPSSATGSVDKTWKQSMQKLIFSATLTKDSGKWANLKIKQPRIVIVGDNAKSNAAQDLEFSVPATLNEYVIAITDVSVKPLLLLNILREQYIEGNCIIFARSNEITARLARLLEILEQQLKSEKKYRIGFVTGEVDSVTRKKTLRKLAQNEIDIVICTDIIARGMDIESIQTVINYDIPISAREYVHRVGRTARAGREGTAYSLVSRPEGKWFKNMTAKIGRSKTKKVMRLAVEVWEGQEEAYGRCLEILEKQVRG
ncbi:P-loop containing nucleoside triphosphate hydrolase protein [Lipomyces japonicus]|uniref:P-loop containing nucleoside triphosphate hydrolase protein n=1 Tax=Lipomyces japonicus TaxID=56871 RepID=UPI0034CFEA42